MRNGVMEANATVPVMTGQVGLLAGSATNPLSRQKPQPLYAQIKQVLRTRILDGVYAQHDRIPSEHELMAVFGVSRITVRQALSDLENEQLIFKIPGKGAFVSKPRPFQELARLQGLGEALQRIGITVTNRLVGVNTVAADAVIAKKLKVPEGSPLTEIRRVRLADGEAVSFEVTYVRRELGERLVREDLVTRDIFVIIENDYDTPLGHADLIVDAMVADNALANRLGVALGAPILRIERLTRTRDLQPIDFEYLYYRGDGFRYQLRVERG